MNDTRSERSRPTNDVRSERVELSVDGDDVGVRYLAGGDGPPLVLCHGIGLDAASVSWRHVLPSLADDYAVYAPDLPGHGESDKPRRTYTTDYYVNVLREFLSELGVGGAGLVGTSMGGAVTLGHALDGGDPARLVLVDSYGLGADAHWRGAMSAALRVPFADDLMLGTMGTRAGVRTHLSGLVDGTPADDLVEDVAGTVSSSTMRTLRSWQRHEFRPDGLRTNYLDRLGEIDVPTTLLHGRTDPLFPVSWSERAHERIRNSELEVVENCGHWLPRERPAAVERALS
ncbi:alpha/beta fold hydrolase [Halomicrobium salinisoli]|uniref:alpha/beta fold hydrolase n=1 Tax=Halomicrobium salinisoli TaxID=2878391 RepID=UPI001CF0668B|nr:alpha/beta hydrolase [Halomicrobium salinisoli]